VRFQLACLLAISVASAPLGAQVTVKLTAPNAPNGGTVAAFGFYMSPYTGTVDGQQFVLNCDDFFHRVDIGDVWKANETNLSNGSNLSNTRFGDITLYQEAAYLTTQYGVNPATDKNRSIAIQTAIWDLFEGQTANAPDPSVTAWTDENSAWWVHQAQTNYATAGLDYSTFSVLTDVNALTSANQYAPYDASSEQEFIIHTTPEPATVVLLATGLIGIIPITRRRKAIRG
jgi:PEP-CTERM motif-containing protein